MSQNSKYEKEFVRIAITESMLDYAHEIESEVKIHRTKASPQDSVIGILGEMAFAYWLKSDWRWHDPRRRRGLIDFEDSIEIKTSAFKFSRNLNLLVREDYALSRNPDFYVQVIIDGTVNVESKIEKGVDMILCGYATHEEVKKSPLRDFGSKFGGKGGYKCHYISIDYLHPMEELRSKLTILD